MLGYIYLIFWKTRLPSRILLARNLSWEIEFCFGLFVIGQQISDRLGFCFTVSCYRDDLSQLIVKCFKYSGEKEERYHS